jgi:hypothetical protein
MRAWFHCTGAELIGRAVADTVGRLASAQQARGLPGSADQEFAWQRQVAALRDAIAEAGGDPGPSRSNTTCCGSKSAWMRRC